MTSLVIHEQQDAKLPTMVVAFAGWPDAAESATRAIRYMVRKLPGRRFAEIDPEDYYDFTIVRPQSRINGKGDRVIKWPCNEFYSYVPETNPQDGLLLYVGTEPNLKWKTYTETVMEVAKANGVELIVSLGALLDAVPHTRDVRVTGRASSEGLAKKSQWLGIRNSGYQGPTGIHSALNDICNRDKMPHANIWAHCPHYVQTSPNPIASHALLQRLKRLVNFNIDMSELQLSGEAFTSEVTRAISKQPDVTSYVAKLEGQYDKDISQLEDMPTGTDMVLELEEYLRSQSGGQGPT